MDEGKTLAEAVAEERGTTVITDEEITTDPIEEVREKLGIGEGIDPLTAFLEADRSATPTKQVHIKRLNTDVTVEAIMDSKEYERLVDRCTMIIKGRRGGRRQEIDGVRLVKLTIAEYTVNPPFHPKRGREAFEKLAAHYGTTDPEALVERALLIGERDLLSDTIMQLSGFDDELEDTAGN